MKSALAVFVVAVIACGDPAGPNAGYPASATLADGPLAGEVAKSVNVTVVVKDSSEQIVVGRLVNFVVTSGGGSVFAGSSITDDKGEAKEVWTLGTVAADQTLEARWVAPNGTPVALGKFTVSAKPGAPTIAASIGGTDRVMWVGKKVRIADYVNPTPAKDQFGNAIALGPITYTASVGITLTADSLIVTAVGTHTLRAQATGLDATLTYTGLADLTKGFTVSSKCVDASADSIVYAMTTNAPTVNTTATTATFSGTPTPARIEYLTGGAGTATQSVSSGGAWTITQSLAGVTGMMNGANYTFAPTSNPAELTTGGTLCPSSFPTKSNIRLRVKP